MSTPTTTRIESSACCRRLRSLSVFADNRYRYTNDNALNMTDPDARLASLPHQGIPR